MSEQSDEATIRILFLGDIVGEPGRKAVIDELARIKEEHSIDFVIANGENSAGGRGITPRIAIDLLRAGIAVITTGDHVWDQQEIVASVVLPEKVEEELAKPVEEKVEEVEKVGGEKKGEEEEAEKAEPAAKVQPAQKAQEKTK